MWRQNGADNLIRTAKEKKKKRIFRNEKSLRDNIKHTSICITEFPEDKREKGAETFFEKIMVKTSLMWGRTQTSRFRKHQNSQAR